MVKRQKGKGTIGTPKIKYPCRHAARGKYKNIYQNGGPLKMMMKCYIYASPCCSQS